MHRLHGLAMLFGILVAPVDDMVIHSFGNGLAGVRAANPDVHLSVGRDSSGPDEPVLQVEYPAPTGNPAGRDVQCEAENRNWSSGRAVSFQVKPAHALRLSVSFIDRNRVVYTSWAELKEGVWQTVRFAFADMKPNPYFQPPDAKQGSAIDVSDVAFIAFAPQDQTSGRLAISRFVVEK
ncbi:MAG TPA: carbohydrate binding domain-containing protein [Vicinamibacterales bacterium]|nr:carbohydrate binding domain-containing protein [Vicinamibacterales bacterium]